MKKMKCHLLKQNEKGLNSLNFITNLIKEAKGRDKMRNNSESKKETNLFEDVEIFNSFKRTRQMIRDAGLMSRMEYDQSGDLILSLYLFRNTLFSFSFSINFLSRVIKFLHWCLIAQAKWSASSSSMAKSVSLIYKSYYKERWCIPIILNKYGSLALLSSERTKRGEPHE